MLWSFSVPWQLALTFHVPRVSRPLTVIVIRSFFVPSVSTPVHLPVSGPCGDRCQAGGTCVDFNAFNLHDYKEFLDCGFTRSFQSFDPRRGEFIWTNAPRGRPMFAILEIADGVSGDATYQWRRNGSPLANGGRISGADTDSLTGFGRISGGSLIAGLKRHAG